MSDADFVGDVPLEENIPCPLPVDDGGFHHDPAFVEFLRTIRVLETEHGMEEDDHYVAVIEMLRERPFARRIENMRPLLLLIAAVRYSSGDLGTIDAVEMHKSALVSRAAYFLDRFLTNLRTHGAA